MEFKHISVLLNEVLENLNIKPNGIYIDCTLGGAGHSSEILKRLDADGKLIGIDQDANALNYAKQKLSNYSNVIYVHNNFYNIREIIEELSLDGVDGILMDLGVSSYQLDTAERGFSYMQDAPLDMRMNEEDSLSAFDVVNEYSKEELIRIFREYGEEKFAVRVAGKIIENRENKSIETTLELVDIIKKAIPMKFQKKGHPAKKVFQAIRIEVNKELAILNKSIEDAVDKLNVGGRIAIITFHSLEDRIVKTKFNTLSNPCICPPDFPICACGKKPKIKLISRKPIEPTELEKEENSRSKSAKLRVAEKISSN
ncbi:16S rRNA (cytosine(1402)-N(4))-methyltransferase RsmH [Clostridium sediminicola]|uniref:16S rRNA (cytosine(1402)-N(4))-methyltransferase RsmH n=1 Tax=Clostridium sediminicola TaxID=3114879 RepID=UPI0031F26DCB